MKKWLIFIAVLTTCLIMFGQSAKEMIDSAKQVNANYRIYELNMKKNQLDYDKTVIEAINKKSEFAAEISRLNSENQTQGNLSAFYTEILNRIFEVKTQQINLAMSDISQKIAELDYQDSQNLFDKGLISSTDLQNASITLRDAKTDNEQKAGDLDLALKNYKEDVGLEWESVDIFLPDYNQYVITDNKWLEDSKSVQISEYNLEMAEFDIENLSMNASKYDQTIADIVLEQKKIDLRLSKENALNQKRDLEDSLYFLKKQLETLQERLSLSNDDLEDVQTRHQKGLVSDTQLFNQEKSQLSVLSQYTTTLKSYWTTLSQYVINSDQDLEEALRKNLEKVESEALKNE